MKPQEAQLIREISELQSMVSELKGGFSRALLELTQIQNGDTRLREDLDQAKQHCNQQALHLQAQVYSLKVELQEVRQQMRQFHDNQQKLQQGLQLAQLGRVLGLTQTQRNSRERRVGGGTQRDSVAPGNLLLHGYLQGLQAGRCPRTETPAMFQVSPEPPGPTSFLINHCNTDLLQDSSVEDRRQQVAVDLLHSEQEYLSTLYQLHNKYKVLSAMPKNQESCQTFLACLEQLSHHHLLFRNALEDRLFGRRWQGLLGDMFAKLTCQNDCTFSDMYLGYLRKLPEVLSSFHHSDGIIHNFQGCLGEKEELQQVSFLLAPILRIHSYLNCMQDLLQWTGREHPDHYLLQVSERTLRHFLSQCHVILEKDGLEGDKRVAEYSNTSSPPLYSPSSCQSSTPRGSNRQSEPGSITNRNDLQLDAHSHGTTDCPASPSGGEQLKPYSLMRKSFSRDNILLPFSSPHHTVSTGCGGTGSFLLAAADPAVGKGTGSAGQSLPPAEGVCFPEPRYMKGASDDCDTDLDDLGDTSVFDYSSVTSCSLDGTLEMKNRAAGEGGGDPEDGSSTEEEDEEEEEEEEEDSQVPVLLKPTHGQTKPLQAVLRAGSVCLKGQVSGVPPHPPPGKPSTAHANQPTPGPGVTTGNRLSSTQKPSSQHLPIRAIRTISKESLQQGDSTLLTDGKIPHKTQENPGRLSASRGPSRGTLRSVLGVAFYHAHSSNRRETEAGGTSAWDDSDDEGPCSTV
ncbi:uncharacterized protein LOC118786609 [Megalops cyprinoides]|uniref:uncharacterized protein LOC118786609 n=1 Tax=Megalops cyprinoides TaxID=118141 RepID=UPI0018652D90|nr:uncharacterized protein LOC118786609 [Megalops cyprinoides]